MSGKLSKADWAKEKIMSKTYQELDLYNPQFEKGKTFKSLDDTRNFLETREKFTFEIKDITGLEIIDKGVKMALDVIEVDDNLHPQPLGLVHGLAQVVHLAQALGMRRDFALIECFS